MWIDETSSLLGQLCGGQKPDGLLDPLFHRNCFAYAGFNKDVSLSYCYKKASCTMLRLHDLSI